MRQVSPTPPLPRPPYGLSLGGLAQWAGDLTKALFEYLSALARRTNNAATYDELADVAFSGDYDDLSNKPTLGTIASHDTNEFVGYRTATLDLYVRPDGSDSNDGQSNTPGGAFLTLQKAAIVGLSYSGAGVQINVADGVYTAGVSLSPQHGQGNLQFVGNPSNPAACEIDVVGNAFTINDGFAGALTLNGFTLTPTQNAIVAASGRINFQNIIFSAATNHIQINGYATVMALGDFTVAGGAVNHCAVQGGRYVCTNRTVTLIGTPAFTTFINAFFLGFTSISGCTFIGSATGKRYNAQFNGLVYVAGAGATYLPGDAAGTTSTGGQYL